ILLVDRVDDSRLAERGEQPRALARLGADNLALPRDDAAAGALLVELPGVAVPRVEVILRAPHVPLLFGLPIRLRAPRRAARAGALRSASAAGHTGRCARWGTRRWRTCRWSRRRSRGRWRVARRVRRDPAAILHAAVDVAGAFHLHLQLEVRGLSALPDEIDRAGRLLAGRLDGDRAVLDLPIRVTR